MRYDVETAAATLFANYLNAVASTQPGYVLDPAACPIVTFFDPMSVADADRVVVMCPTATTDIPDAGRFQATMDIGVKTQWTQATITAQFKMHFARVNDVRDKLMLAPLALATALVPYLPQGMAVDFVQPQKHFSTHIAESSTSKWIYSGTQLDIVGYFTAGT